nr:hypothetical protein BaRGS_022295 [Batillaria attramentaria]
MHRLAQRREKRKKTVKEPNKKSVMAAGLDGDLVGVVAAAVVIGVLLIIIIGFMAYCCFRRMETERTPVILRKDSSTMLTVTPRWSANTHPTIPVFNVATEPYLYNTHPYYYLGDYRPKYIGAEPLQYVHPYRLELEDRRRVEQREEEEHVQPTTLQVEHTSQPNGHVVHDFSSSSANYRVIRKHHQHTRMPDWLTKSYGESKMSMDLEDEGSRVGSMRLALTSGQEEQDDPERAARAQVSPRDSTLDARDLLHYSDDFTIIDYVDPDRGRPRSAGYISSDSVGSRDSRMVER